MSQEIETRDWPETNPEYTANPEREANRPESSFIQELWCAHVSCPLPNRSRTCSPPQIYSISTNRKAQPSTTARCEHSATPPLPTTTPALNQPPTPTSAPPQTYICTPLYQNQPNHRLHSCQHQPPHLLYLTFTQPDLSLIPTYDPCDTLKQTHILPFLSRK